MDIGIYTIALLLFVVGVLHSVLGERFLIRRLLKRDNLPRIYNSEEFTRNLIRFAWHITTIAWWGMAVIALSLLLPGPELIQSILITFSVTFFISGLIAFYYSSGKHFAWGIFLLISLAAYSSI